MSKAKSQASYYNYCQCGQRWASPTAAHCGLCHRLFRSDSAMSKHLRSRTCFDPAKVGMEELEPLRGDPPAWGYAPRGRIT